jgi:hypothetical protein
MDNLLTPEPYPPPSPPDALSTAQLIKRSQACICGLKKLKGAPFCNSCWACVPAAERECLRNSPDYDHAYGQACLAVQVTPQAAPRITLKAPPGPDLPHSPAKALILLALSETEIDRVFLAASVEQKAYAMRAMLGWDADRA